LRPREWGLIYKKLPLWIKILVIIVILLYTVPPILLLFYIPGAKTDIIHKIDLPWILEWTTTQALASATISIMIGLPIGIGASYYTGRIAKSYLQLGMPVFMAPSVSIIMGFRWLSQITNIKAFSHAPLGIILIHSYYNIPLAAVLTYSSIAGVIGELRDYIETIGLRGLKLWKNLLLPAALPGAISAWILAFIYSFIGLAAPLMVMGSAYKYYTLEAWIYTLYTGFPDYLRLAIMLSLGQALMLAITAYILLKISEARPRAPLGKRVEYGKRSKTVIILDVYALIILIYLYLPIAGVFIESLTGPQGFTLEAYHRLFTNRLPIPPGASFMNSLINSLLYASITVILAVLLSIPVSLSKGLSQRLASLSPLLFSPVTVGLALYLVLYDSLARIIPSKITIILLVIIAHISASLPLASRAIDQAMARVEREIMQFLAQLEMKGASLLYHLGKLVTPGIISASLLSAAASLGEFGATLVITDPRTWSLGVLTYNLYSAGRLLSIASASASILLSISLIISFLLSTRITEWF